ncbi:MAG: SRPBCC family protein [Bacteroidota bacterium]
MTVEQSITIAAPAPTIFNYLLEVENRKDYIPALEEVILLDSPPIRLGSRYIEVANIAGRRLRTTYQVIAFEENKLMSAKTLESIFPIQADLRLLEKTDGCVLQINLSFQLKGVLRLAAGVVSGIVSQQARDILKKVKYNLEKG